MTADQLKGITTGTNSGAQLAVTRGLPYVRYGHIVLSGQIPGQSISGNMAIGSDEYTVSRDSDNDRWVVNYKVTTAEGADKVITLHGSMADYAALQNVTARMNAFKGKVLEYTELDGVIDLYDGIRTGLTGFNQGTLTGFNGSSTSDGFAIFYLTINVANSVQLEQVMRKLHQVSGVMKVTRSAG